MAPQLLPGMLVVGVCWFRTVRPTDIIVFEHDGIEKIKRVKKVRGSEIFVVGDNASLSTDSRAFGWVPADKIIAKLWY